MDHIITFVHWGKEYMSIPNEEQRQLAIELRKLGVKVIVGSHPHVKQGHEWINDTLVHYSLGNFLFHPHYTFMGVSEKKDCLFSKREKIDFFFIFSKFCFKHTLHEKISSFIGPGTLR